MGALVAGILAGGVASAAQVTITTAMGVGADNMIQNDNQSSSTGPTAVSGTSSQMEVRYYWPSTSTANRLKMAVLKFDLSSVTDLAVEGAKLSMATRTTAGGTTTAVLAVRALVDDTADGWLTSNMSFSTMPGISAPDGFGTYVIDENVLALAGSWTISNPRSSNGPWETDPTLCDLDSIINRELGATGNKILTLLVLMPDKAASADVFFYTKENTSSMPAPSLIFNTIPEPATLAILGLGGLLLRRRLA
jgi:hypothetical protein